MGNDWLNDDSDKKILPDEKHVFTGLWRYKFNDCWCSYRVKLHIPVFHVEAGLRLFNKKMPEEINRTLTDHISDLLFTPSALANNNLIREGIEEDKIFEVGDIMLDAIQFAQAKISIKSNVHNSERKGHVLASIHRQENTDDIHRLENICKALEYLVRQRDSFSHSSANNEKT